MVWRRERLQWQQPTGHIPELSQVITQVTVFGGSGFIGRHLVEHLARAGASVRVATRHPPQTAEPSRLARIQQVEADILDDEAVQAAIERGKAPSTVLLSVRRRLAQVAARM